MTEQHTKLIDLRTTQFPETEVNQNENLTKVLEQLSEQIQSEIALNRHRLSNNRGSCDSNQQREKIKSDGFRLRQVQKAVKALARHPYPIVNGHQAQQLPGIGPGIARRIDEILLSGGLVELKNWQQSKEQDRIQLVNGLTRVHGLGEQKAQDLIDGEGIRSLEDLRERYRRGDISLPFQVELGLKYFDDLQKKIPRAEIDQVDTILKEELRQLDPRLQHYVCGSYRRGKAESNDIDVLIVHPEVETRTQLTHAVYSRPYLYHLLIRLSNCGFLVDHLTKLDSHKYMGFCRVYNQSNALVRRIDLLWLPTESLGAGLMHFTGSKQFNQKIRLVARRRGYSLSEYGLSQRDSPDTLVASRTEREIFERLGVVYLTPEQRSLRY